MIVGVASVVLYIPGCQSLKEKRHVLRSLKDRVHHKFGVPLSEVGEKDLWQKATVGFAVVGDEKATIEGFVSRMIDFFACHKGVEVLDVFSEMIAL